MSFYTRENYIPSESIYVSHQKAFKAAKLAHPSFPIQEIAKENTADRILNSIQSVTSAAPLAALYNPYVAGILAATGAGIAIYQTGKKIYNALT